MKNVIKTMLLALLILLGVGLMAQSSPNGEFSFTQVGNVCTTSLGDTYSVLPDKEVLIDDLGHLYNQGFNSKIYYSAPWNEEALFLEVDSGGQILQSFEINNTAWEYTNNLTGEYAYGFIGMGSPPTHLWK